MAIIESGAAVHDARRGGAVRRRPHASLGTARDDSHHRWRRYDQPIVQHRRVGRAARERSTAARPSWRTRGVRRMEGTIELTCGAQTVTARAGDFVYAPKDVAQSTWSSAIYQPGCSYCSPVPGLNHSSRKAARRSTGPHPVRRIQRPSSACSTSIGWSFSRRRRTDSSGERLS